MTDDDYPAYAALIDQIADRYHYDMHDDQIRQDFAALKKYRLVDVTWAYLEHRHHTTRGRWMPRPDDVLQRLETPPRRRLTRRDRPDTLSRHDPPARISAPVGDRS